MPTALLVGPYGHGTLAEDTLVDAFAAGLPGWRLATATLDVSGAMPTCEPVGPRMRPVLRQALESDAVVFGGGTLFTQLHPSSGRRPLGRLASAAALTTASGHRRPVAILGVGAAAVTSRAASAFTRQIVRRSRLLVLGDEESAAVLVGAGVPGPLRVGADPSWVLLQPPLSAHGGGDSVLVVPPRLAPAGREELQVDRLVATTRHLVGAGMSVELRAWERACTPGRTGRERGPRHDTLVAAVAEQAGRGVRVGPTPASLSDAVEVMRHVAAVVTYRFHGLVAAGAAGAPTVAVAHEPKLGELAARLGQPAVQPGVDPPTLAQTVLATAAAGGPDPSAVKHEIAKADEGFRLLRVVLAGGRTDESDGIGALPLRRWR